MHASGICGVNDKLGTAFFKETCEPANGVCSKEGNAGLATWDNGYVDTFSGSGILSISGYGGSGFATSSSGCSISRGTGYTSGGKLSNNQDFTVDKKLKMWLATDTEENKGYVLQFSIRNPIQKQSSPQISIEGKIGDESHALQGYQYLHANSPNGATTAYAPGSSTCGIKQARHVMTPDSTTLLCCTSCSYAKQAVAASTAARSASAIDGQMTLQGDAEPLKIHTPFFCSKSKYLSRMLCLPFTLYDHFVCCFPPVLIHCDDNRHRPEHALSVRQQHADRERDSQHLLLC
jgi:hypothetical protein